MMKKYFDANTMHIVNKETGECIDTGENDVIEVKAAKDSKHSVFKKNDYIGSRFCSLNTEIFNQKLKNAKLKWTEQGFFKRMEEWNILFKRTDAQPCHSSSLVDGVSPIPQH